MIRLLFWAVAGLIGAGIVHGVSLLAIPRVAPATAYDRLAAADADGRFVPLASGDPGRELLPFEDTSFVEAVCRYDLAAGPVRIFAPFPDSYGSVTFYNRFGQAYYSLTDRAASQRGVNVVVLDADHVEVGDAAGDEGQASALRIVSPTPAGFVMLRLHVQSPAARGGLRDLAMRARCASAPAS